MNKKIISQEVKKELMKEAADIESYVKTIKDGLVNAKNEFMKFLHNLMDDGAVAGADVADVAKSIKTSSTGASLLRDTAFKSMLGQVASNIGVRPTDLVRVMNKESGLKPHAYNSRSGAAGLIQFMPSTARALGVTTQEIREMSALEQLGLVEKYYKPYRGKVHDAADLYIVTFFPAALGKPDDWVLRTKKLSAEKIASYNPAIAKGKNYITVADVKRFINS